jgi:hypothetical protein
MFKIFMTEAKEVINQIQFVTNFRDLVVQPHNDAINAICWQRELVGDFLEIINKIEELNGIMEIDLEILLKLDLSEKGILARDILINDLQLLKTHGASPSLNIISQYERDENYLVFPTDVYSFHVDRSPIPTHTFLCTYYGEPSEIVPNDQAIQKVLVPEIREELKKIFDGNEQDFEMFLSENFFDLHYQTLSNAKIINLGLGNLWRLAVDHSKSKVLPCIHRAPKEKINEKRLLLIC